jgi:hypothetical protein
VAKYAVERPRHLGEIQRLDEQPRVSDFPTAAAAHEAPQLLVGWAISPRGLFLQGAKRSELALRVDDLFHRGGTEGANQLVLQVCGADEKAQPLHAGASQPGAEAGSLETAPEVSVLSGVAETRQPDVQPPRTEPVEELPDGLCAPDRHNRDALSLEVATTALSQSLQRALVAEPLNKHDRTGSCRMPSRRRVHPRILATWTLACECRRVGR